MSDLQVGEPHPAAHSALIFVKACPDLEQWLEAFASTALDGNRGSEICHETLRRVMAGEPVSDRYVLGLAWTMRMSVETYERGVQ